jgi:hypothetical protein
VGKEITYQIRKDIDVRLEESQKKADQKRMAVKLVVSVPVYYDEDEEITIACLGTDGNFSISKRAIEEAGLTLVTDEEEM